MSTKTIILIFILTIASGLGVVVFVVNNKTEQKQEVAIEESTKESVVLENTPIETSPTSVVAKKEEIPIKEPEPVKTDEIKKEIGGIDFTSGVEDEFVTLDSKIETL